jgi:hypothetical protein
LKIFFGNFVAVKKRKPEAGYMLQGTVVVKKINKLRKI